MPELRHLLGPKATDPQFAYWQNVWKVTIDIQLDHIFQPNVQDAALWLSYDSNDQLLARLDVRRK